MAAGNHVAPSKRSQSIGTDATRIDIRDKVTGRARYGSDLERDGLLHAAVVRSDQPHARLLSVDVDAALEQSGVVAAVPREQLIGRFDDRVRFVGDVIAAVAADDPRTAQRAAASVTYDLEPLESLHDPRSAVDADAIQIHENNTAEWKTHNRHPLDVDRKAYRRNIDDYHQLSYGDIEDGFEQADVILEEEYVTPRVNHCNLDTHCCLAEWVDDTLTVTETIASPGRAREELAQFMGIEEANLVIETPPTASSSFGGQSLPKLTLEPVAATLAAESNRPVKLWFDRSEDFLATEHRHRTYYTVKMGITEEGDLTAVSLDLVADTGAYPNGVGHIVLTYGRDRPPEIYDIPNYEFEGVSVYTNNLVGGEYRGIGGTQVGFVLESHMDELARRAGLDPVDFHHRNFVVEGQERPHTGTPIESCGVAECLDRGMNRFTEVRYGGTDTTSVARGWGFASTVHATSLGASRREVTEAEIVISEDGSVVVKTGAIEHGQGSDTVMAQMASEGIGTAVEDIRVQRFSTADDLEDELGSVASRSTYLIGGAVKKAADKLVENLQEVATETFDVNPREVDVLHGKVVVGGSDYSFSDLLDRANLTNLRAVGTAEADVSPPSYGVHFAEVEVDVETFEVDVLTYVAAQDVGFAINPQGVKGQLEGAVTHGIEFGLYSELKLREGHLLNGNLADYPAITTCEMPNLLECEIIESNEETGPYGAKGVGTPALPPVAPALLNAVRDATGVRFTKAPVTGEDLKSALLDD